MADLLSLDLVSKNFLTNQLVLTIGYDIDNITKGDYSGEIVIDHYGRKIPKHSHGTINLDHNTSSSKIIIDNMVKLYDKIVNKNLLIKRINMTANTIDESVEKEKVAYEQLDLFTNYEEDEKQREENRISEEEEHKLQHVLIDIKNKYGKNAILKGMNLEEGGTTIDRNNQIGGHRK